MRIGFVLVMEEEIETKEDSPPQGNTPPEIIGRAPTSIAFDRWDPKILIAGRLQPLNDIT